MGASHLLWPQEETPHHHQLPWVFFGGVLKLSCTNCLNFSPGVSKDLAVVSVQPDRETKSCAKWGFFVLLSSDVFFRQNKPQF